MISFVIPAHNEQASLGKTLQAIHDSVRPLNQPYEIIVVDDASTDATPEIARQHDAIVHSVNHRQIAATRNSGARAARGEKIFFVDADTTVNSRAIASALKCMDKGAVGGGATVWFDKPLPLYVQLVGFLVAPIITKLLGFTGGAFMFCTSKAYHASGGFDERLFWGEEGSLAVALRQEGRFVVLWERVLTSGRRFRTMSGLEVFANCVRLALTPLTALTKRSSVEKIWYDSNRTHDDILPDTLGVKISNGIMLIIVLVLFSGPVWNFVPAWPIDTLLGKIRFVIVIFLSHAGMLFWPATIFLLKNLLKKKQWMEWIKMALLCAFCAWQAWGATQGVYWFWRWIFGLVTKS